MRFRPRVCSALLLAVVAPVLLSLADEPAGEKPAAEGIQALLVTIDDEQTSGRIVELADGQLVLAGEPQRRVALADLQRIEIGKTIANNTSSDLVWIGQDNHDLVQIGGASGGNGIQDIHLHATNLKPQGIKQIDITCRFNSKQLRVWRLDTSRSPHWRLAIARADLAADAELYIEPAADSFGQKFDATFTYNDGSTTRSSVVGATHTSDQLKLENGAPANQQAAKTPTAPVTTSKAIVYLGDAKEGRGQLHGDLVGLDSESLVLRTGWNPELQIPLLRVGGVWFGKSGSRAEFDKQLAAAASDDVVFLTAGDGTPAQVACSVTRLSDGKLSVRYNDADRTINFERLLGIVFAAHPKTAPVRGPYQVFMLASGDALSGVLAALDPRELTVETLWNTRVQVPVGSLAEIRFRNGKLTSLVDLEPASVEETGYFGRVMHWRRDQGFDDAPAKVKGRQPARCLAMHSRSVLTYALEEPYEKFKVRLGFDDSAADRGRVACRVLVDGREAFAEKDFRSTAEPIDVEVPLAGAKQLTLEVDFGEAEDVGDRIIWADPRLFRAASEGAASK